MLQFKHISKASEEFLTYVRGRKLGIIKSLRTELHKLNKALLGGFDWNRIVTIAGMSGAGKSVLLEQIKRNACDLNRDQKLLILSYEFEMLSLDQVARSVSGKTGKSTKHIYSGDGNVLTEEEYSEIELEAKEISKRPIFYIDDVGSAEEIYNTTKYFAEYHKMKEKGLSLVVTIDHVLLTKGKEGQTEQKIISDLYKYAIRLKKEFAAEGMQILIIMASQLNREIEKPERVLNNKLHYPNRTDIFGSSSIFFASDYVIVIHKPLTLDGMTSESGYGPKSLPLFNPNNPELKQPMVYLHILKERFGTTTILSMVDSFHKSKLEEYFPQKKEKIN